MAHKDNKHHSILNNILLLAKYKNYAYEVYMAKNCKNH